MQLPVCKMEVPAYFMTRNFSHYLLELTNTGRKSPICRTRKFGIEPSVLVGISLHMPDICDENKSHIKGRIEIFSFMFERFLVRIHAAFLTLTILFHF